MLSPAITNAVPDVTTPGDLAADQLATNTQLLRVGGNPLSPAIGVATPICAARGDLDRGQDPAATQQHGAPVISSNGDGQPACDTQRSSAVADPFTNGRDQDPRDIQAKTVAADSSNGDGGHHAPDAQQKGAPASDSSNGTAAQDGRDSRLALGGGALTVEAAR